MSYPNLTSKSGSNCSLINQILVQGQRLRNSMVQTVLRNDPFNTEILKSGAGNQQNESDGIGKAYCCADASKRCYDNLSDNERVLLKTYLKGDEMGYDSERKTLDILHSMDPTSIVQLTSRESRDAKYCCSICKEYSQFSVSSESLKVEVPTKSKNVTKKSAPANNLLKYVDSLKVLVYSVTFTSAGIRKISSENANKLLPFDHSYFVQYKLPDVLIKRLNKSKAKVNSGLDSNKSVKLFTRKLVNDTVLFKQESVHFINNVAPDLDANVEFEVSYRSVKERAVHLIGKAFFNIGSLLASETLTSNQELPVISDRSPIILGRIKIVLQFGSEKLHFGKDLVDAINCAKEPPQNDILTARISSCPDRTPKVPQKNAAENVVPVRNADVENEYLLYGIIYLTEAKFLNRSPNSYLICRSFHKDDTLISKTVHNTSNPAYRFQQRVPILLNDETVSEFRDNYIVIEVWEKRTNTDLLIGICKLSLHQLYVAYRNSNIRKYLLISNNPVVSVDAWESIVDPVNNYELGQLKAIVALGTEQQIDNFSYKINISDNVPVDQNINTATTQKTTETITTSDITSNITDKNTANAATQSEIMDNNQTDNNQQNSAFMSQRELLNSFVDQILNQRNKYVENSTNTEEMNVEAIIPVPSNTTEANPVDSDISNLQTTPEKLIVDNEIAKRPEDSFKARIVIENALHLPSRKKCKSKRSKTKTVKNKDEILPSTYVTFKTCTDKEMVVTPVVPKSTSPSWEFACDAHLPAELLINNQKRLVFKVWRKSSGPLLIPNNQTDIVIGFAAVDLTALLAGLPTIQGWFNIVDFTNKCNGQIQIHVTPQENLSKYNEHKKKYIAEQPPALPTPQLEIPEDHPSELLNRALKRKFTELDEITRRLKQRLSSVTKDDSDVSNDDFATEFERDLNTECVETEDATFQDKCATFNSNYKPSAVDLGDAGCSNSVQNRLNDILGGLDDSIAKSDDSVAQSGDSVAKSGAEENPPLSHIDTHLIEEKLKINTLLEKLTLITETDNRNSLFSNRYVSGCSANEVETSSNSILEQLGLKPTEPLHPESVFNPLVFQQLFGAPLDSTPGGTEHFSNVQQLSLEGLINSESSSNSISSNSTQISSKDTSRQAPDGAGNVSE